MPSRTTGSGNPVSLLIVDDHRMFADVLAMRLGREPGVHTVRSAYSLAEAQAVARQMRPDVVVLDHDLNGHAGSALIAELHQLPDPPRVVMLSASERTADVISSLECGADGWVVKGTQVDDLMTAVDEVLQGHAYLHPSIIRAVVDGLLDRRRRERTPTFVDNLSERQLEVLRCLVGGLSRADIAERLVISVNTARTHVQHLLEASGEHSTLALIARSREAGVRGIDDDAPATIGLSSH